jgi:hypothetical protein
MEVPVPVGASAELREQLIREAEANMEQFYRRVEARARGQRPPEAVQRGVPQPQPQQPSQQVPQPAHQAHQEARPVQRLQPSPSIPTPSPAPAPAPSASREGPQAISLQDRRTGASTSPIVPSVSGGSTTSPAAQVRSGISAELPVTPGLASTGSGTMKLSEFIQIIRENWGLSAKQAMDLLQVKSLNNMNYRDLLRQLEPLVEQSSAKANNTNSAVNRQAPAPPAPPAPSASPAAARPSMSASSAQAPVSPVSSPPLPRTPLPAAPQRDTGQPARPVPPQGARAPQSPQPSQSSQSQQASNASQQSGAGQRAPSSPSPSSRMEGPANIPVYPLRESTLREPARIYKFDEEEEDQEDLEGEDGLDAKDAGDNAARREAEDGTMSMTMARLKIDELKDLRSSSGANPGRLVVLHNLLDSQISDEQFLQLIEGLWNTVSDKKLKQDQVEALISWAKEDYFEDEVRAVLAVLNEQP